MDNIQIKQYKYKKDDLSQIFKSRATKNEKVKKDVKEIIDNVREFGDEKLFEYIKKFDNSNFDKSNLILNRNEIAKILKEYKIDKKLVCALKNAADNIRIYHSAQNSEQFSTARLLDGATLGWKYEPIKSVAIYVPGGTATYPSTVLMCAIPAVVAGVKEVVLCTPNISNPLVLLAAKIAGVDKVYQMGGAHAVAALTYGTESVKRVDKIVGPGNIYVAEAKRQVYGEVGIDMIAGPSEVLILADDSANPKYIAADLLAQAEHDRNAACYLITTNHNCYNDVIKYVNQFALENKERYQIIADSLNNNGAIIYVDSIKDAVNIVNTIAPEHLELLLEPADVPFCIKNVYNAGAIFVGAYSPECLGDYMAGPSHCLPTSGNARFSSVLGVDTFLKRISIIEYSKDAFLDVSESIQKIADSEGLYSHGFSAKIREVEKNEDF